MNAREVEELVSKHLHEASAGFVDRSVSELVRGEATVREYFILKVDVIGSTRLLFPREGVPYVRLAHTFLSTVDRITQAYGADTDQTEYHGDSVLAFFPLYGNTAEKALTAAVLSHFAVKRLRELDSEFQKFNVHTRTLLHFGKLNVANIGPFRESHRVAIGQPIHAVAIKEKDVSAGVIWASDAFRDQVGVAARAKYLNRHYRVTTVRKEFPVTRPAPLSSLLGLGSGGLSGLGEANTLAALAQGLYPPQVTVLTDTEWRDVEEKTPDGYTVNWALAYSDLGIPRMGTALK